MASPYVSRMVGATRDTGSHRRFRIGAVGLGRISTAQGCKGCETPIKGIVMYGYVTDIALRVIGDTEIG
jgi:hypothetical protein